jgi:hypothetical protein
MRRFVFGLREFIRFVGVGCALKTVLFCEPFVRCHHSGVLPASYRRLSGVFEPVFRGDGGLLFGLCTWAGSRHGVRRDEGWFRVL